MKNYVLAFLFFLRLPAFSQQPIYQPFEVDTAAEPRGGMAYFTTFLQSNLQKPIAAEAKGVGGRVIVSAVVEPDGKVSDVKVVQGFRPDCDREALRVFKGFNAWKPAQKGGQAVRQIVTIPIPFKPNMPFRYIDGTRVSYYDIDRKPLPDSNERVRYKQVSPVDTNGLPAGDVLIFERTNRGWKEYSRLPLVRRAEKYWGRFADQPSYSIGYLGANTGVWQGLVYTIGQLSGTLLRRSYYEEGIAKGLDLTYHDNGLVAERKEESNDQYSVTSWYRNGQIKQLKKGIEPRGGTLKEPEKIVAFWDSTGRQLIKDGTGRIVNIENVMSRLNGMLRTEADLRTQLVEQGMYENGLKQGVWTGLYTDKSYFYEEQYDKGICKGGKAVRAGGDTLRYTNVEQQPEFKGGMDALGFFLSKNLHFPDQAMRANVQGKVFLTFVVNTDGTLQDITVLRGLGFGCDEEAKRVISQTQGKWTPGIQRGEPVRIKYSLPINFGYR